MRLGAFIVHSTNLHQVTLQFHDKNVVKGYIRNTARQFFISSYLSENQSK